MGGDGEHTDHNSPVVLSPSGEWRAEDAGDSLEKIENFVAAPGGEVEEQKGLLWVRGQDDVIEVLHLETGVRGVDVDVHLAVTVNLKSVN